MSAPRIDLASVTDLALRAQLEALYAENEALKAKKIKPLSLKVSDKGAISVYGLNIRFPVTLYKEQMLRLLDFAGEIRAFITENEKKLSVKE